MFHIVLFQPEIPPNTGNVIRLAANTGCRLHLIEPLGFQMEDRLLRRAGLDYREWAEVRIHPSFEEFLRQVAPLRVFAFSTRASKRHTEIAWAEGDALLFGRETAGLPAEVLETLPETRRVRLPMMPGNRSLNLSNAVAVAVFEAWRQRGFQGGR